MIEFRKIGVNEIEFIADYLQQNKNNIEKVVFDLGAIKSNNGYGTLFLQPKNSLFKVISAHCNDGQISSVGFGGPQLGLSLKNLSLSYKNYREGYVPYDGEYVYVFYSSDDSKYTVKITSKNKLIENGKIINDISINDFIINLK